MEGKVKCLCEIQLICKKWLTNKIMSSLSYKVLRAKSLKEFLDDFTKYINTTDEERKVKIIDPKEVLQNG